METNRRQQIAAYAAASYYIMAGWCLHIKRKQKKRRWWRVSLYKSRNNYSASNMLLDLRQEPCGYFENFCRISATDFEYLLTKLGPIIAKSNTNMRESIPVQERFAVTLRYLATGDSFKSLSCLFKFSPQTVSRCVNDVCRALIGELKDEIKLPQTPIEWRNVAKEFKEKWQFPNCLGAIDGKHIVMESPINSGTEFDNYKGTFSVVLMALVNANYEFTYVDIGCQGRTSDGGVFRNTSLFKKLVENQLMLPEDEPLHNNGRPLPYVFVGDDAFPLSTRMMKPYPGVHDKGSERRIFNYRLSRARRVVENVFGILASVFRVFRKPMLFNPTRVTEITMACVLLHNFLRRSRTSRLRYMPPESLDSEIDGNVVSGAWRKNNENMTSFLPMRNVARKSRQEAIEVRNSYAQYFATIGTVLWQDKY